MELEKVANVIIGILVNRDTSIDGEYEYRLFDLKNYENNTKEYKKILTKGCLDKKLTKQGDIIFRLVCPNKIIYVEKEEENFILPSQMCIIRAYENTVDSVFLKWYLESEVCKKQILLNVTGSSIQKISVSSLRKIKIPDVQLDKQKKIRDLIELWEREKKITEMIIDRKNKLYNSIIEEIIEGRS